MSFPGPEQNPYGAIPPTGGSSYGAPPPPSPYGPPAVNPYGPSQFGPGGFPPSNNIGWAIAAIFLCWPFAIPAFIASGKVEDAWRRGDIAGANQASSDAKKWGSIGVYVGLGLYVLSCVIACVIPAIMGVGVCGVAGIGAAGSS